MQVECSRGVKLVADALIGDLADADFDCIALPVGVSSVSQPASRMLHVNHEDALIRHGQHLARRLICALLSG
jgi:hypothetical protein